MELSSPNFNSIFRPSPVICWVALSVVNHFWLYTWTQNHGPAGPRSYLGHQLAYDRAARWHHTCVALSRVVLHSPLGGVCVCEHTHVFSAWWGLLQPSFCHYSRWVLQRQADPCQVAWLGSLTMGYTLFEGINQGRYFINLWKTPDRKKKSKLFRDYNLSKLLILSHSTTSLDLICSYPSL